MTANEAKIKIAFEYIPVTYRRALEYLEHTPANAHELALFLGIGKKSCSNMISKLKQAGVVCIVQRYRRGTYASGGSSVRYGLGCRDVPKLERRAKGERSEHDKIKRIERKALRGQTQIGVWGL